MTLTSNDTEQPLYDHLFRNALIYDGSDGGPVPGEVAVAGERIVAIANLGSIPAGAAVEEHDLKGKALAPGFIDSPYP